MTQGTTVASLMMQAINLLPEDVNLVSISQVENSLQIKAASASERSIVQFITNLLNNPAFKEVKVASAVASSENQSVIVFTLETKFRGKEGN